MDLCILYDNIGDDKKSDKFNREYLKIKKKFSKSSNLPEATA